MPRAISIVLFAAACATTNPPPQPYQPPPPPPPTGDEASPGTPGGEPAPPPAEELPIDPAKEMPQTSLGTNGTLSGLDAEVKVMVDGRADIYSSGMTKADTPRGGVLPTAIALVSGGGHITVTNVRGKTGCDAATPAAPPDGGTCAGGNTNLTSAGGISGIIDHQQTQALVGVFLGPKPPKKPPAILDFSTNKSFAELSPQIGQTFFIGDGLKDARDIQRFRIPAGATTLYLGYADGFSFQGAPGWYADNKGGVSAAVSQHK